MPTPETLDKLRRGIGLAEGMARAQHVHLKSQHKQSAVLDLTTPDGAATLRELAQRADVLVESYDPGYLAGLELGEAELRALNPRLIYLSVTPYGQSGPKAHWPATELTLEAAADALAEPVDRRVGDGVGVGARARVRDRRAIRHHRRAVRVGYALFAISLVLLLTGVALMRFDFFSIRDPQLRRVLYWAHVIAPLAAIWLYILHRLAGPRIRWQTGLRGAAAAAVVVVAMVLLHSAHPRKNATGSKEGKK